ncbi:disease resistance protein RGA3 [Canna indica]|uniref:Disease resistance protein RGA3 n=1 Tax=Canna indica TaxID=4628 RepID=A0AAQ3L2K5_9LILI|nr:disease resistance protein RGA3 [Canna indica]
MEMKKIICAALIVAAASAYAVLAHEGHDHNAPEASPTPPSSNATTPPSSAAAVFSAIPIVATLGSRTSKFAPLEAPNCLCMDFRLRARRNNEMATPLPLAVRAIGSKKRTCTLTTIAGGTGSASLKLAGQRFHSNTTNCKKHHFGSFPLSSPPPSNPYSLGRMAELSIIGWLVSPVIEAMIYTARSYIASHHPCCSDVEEELHGLETTLLQILAVVSAAERHLFIEDPMQRVLLCQMKDSAFEAEDLLDEFDYLLLKCKTEGGNKVSCSVAHSLVFNRKAIAISTMFRAKLKKLLNKLDRVNACAERFLRVVELSRGTAFQQFEAAPWRATCSLLLDREIIGRDAECERVIELLLKSDDQAGLVLSVVGDGGVGKTTLAQVIYNDTRLIDHFDLRIWICVSDNYSDIKLTREILASISDGVNGDFTIFSLNRLQEELQNKLRGKKIFMVLDDVWFDEKMEEWQNRDRWRKLLAPLQCGQKGSKILVTTRMKLVARMLDSNNLVYLKGLEDDECWLLFKKHAFGIENPDAYPELQKIGRQIARMLKGSPLGAKVVGAMLNSELNVQKWKNVLETDIYDGVMPVLRLSYRNLPSHLQRCFAYCSIFPKDWKFVPDKLVFLWMAQGFIQHKHGDFTKMEDVGRIYFNDLLSRSFFQTVSQGDRTFYLMHDLMNDLARKVSKDECFRIEGELSRKIPPTIRHLSINTDVLPQLASICELKNLRTLVFFGSDHIVPNDVFKELSSIRVLDLTGCGMEHLPESFGSSIHLRYLAFCESLITLPASLCRLHHLQVIDASKWCWFGGFPENMDKLISLRHINVCNEYIYKIIGIGKLTCLQELSEFHVYPKNGCRIGELKNLNELQGSLHIRNLENVRNKEDAIMAHLSEKKYIKALRLQWGASRKIKASDADILEGLQPHTNLEELDIINCHDFRAPQWLETNWMLNMKALYLTNCWVWKALPPLGQLPCLRVLKIRDMHAVTKIGCEFYGSGEPKGFPSLEYMRFENMSEWVEWYGVEDYQLFPSLCMLEIRNCPKLKGLPTFLPSVTSISIKNTGPINNADLHSLAQSKPACFSLNISSSAALCEEFLHRHHFKSVEVLNMSGNGPMPMEEFREFLSLRILRIEYFFELALSTIPQEQDLSFMPSSLVHFSIATCGLGDETLSRCLRNLTSLSSLDIVSCYHIVSLPSTEVLCQLTALQQLLIANCEELLSLGGLKDVTSLKHLKVISCPKLLASLNTVKGDNCDGSDGMLPLSLVHLEIRSCGLVNASLSTFLKNLTSLTTMKIESVHQITSLPSNEVLCHLTALRQAIIRNCPLLSSLGGLETLSFLKTLTLSGCPKLLEPMNQGEEDKSIIMPSSLEILEIEYCGITDNFLSQSLKNLTSLSKLKIECCNNITSFPPADVLCHLTSLKDLNIVNCNKLASVEGLLALVSLTDLNIDSSPELNSFEFLANLKSLSSLKTLNILDGSNFQSLPDNGFPASLEYLCLTRCHPTLKEQLTKKQGPDWEKISHISQLFY